MASTTLPASASSAREPCKLSFEMNIYDTPGVTISACPTRAPVSMLQSHLHKVHIRAHIRVRAQKEPTAEPQPEARMLDTSRGGHTSNRHHPVASTTIQISMGSVTLHFGGALAKHARHLARPAWRFSSLPFAQERQAAGAVSFGREFPCISAYQGCRCTHGCLSCVSKATT